MIIFIVFTYYLISLYFKPYFTRELNILDEKSTLISSAIIFFGLILYNA